VQGRRSGGKRARDVARPGGKPGRPMHSRADRGSVRTSSWSA
jgi:hypothetical protein